MKNESNTVTEKFLVSFTASSNRFCYKQYKKKGKDFFSLEDTFEQQIAGKTKNTKIFSCLIY